MIVAQHQRLGKIQIAKFGDSCGLAQGFLVSRWIATLGHFTEQPLGLLAGLIGRPGGTMPANRVPTLAALGRAVF